MIVLFPSIYGDYTKIESDYSFEYDEAVKNGIKTCTFNFDGFLDSNKPLKIGGDDLPNKVTTAIYRGWMLKPVNYKRLYNELFKQNIKLINSPKEYEACHLFPMSYDKLKKYTPKTVWFPDGEYIDWSKIKTMFNKFIIKDYVKSVKGFDFPKYFDSTYANKELDKYIERFISLRDYLYTGGILIKQYVELEYKLGKTREFRGFYLNKKLVSLYCSSGSLEDKASMLEVIKLANSIPKLGSNFYTVDFAVTKSGNVIVIETGDGQVSEINNVENAHEIYSIINQT